MALRIFCSTYVINFWQVSDQCKFWFGELKSKRAFFERQTTPLILYFITMYFFRPTFAFDALVRNLMIVNLFSE